MKKDKNKLENQKNEYNVKYIFAENSKINVSDVLKRFFLLSLENFEK